MVALDAGAQVGAPDAPAASASVHATTAATITAVRLILRKTNPLPLK
jgi:hypothetical protein